MSRVNTYLKAAPLAVVLIILAPNLSAVATEPAVSFEYAPPEWQTAICLPDDPLKTLVDHEGKLLYHYKALGREFGTTVRVVVADDTETAGQELLSPRIPIVKTKRQAGALSIVEEAFAVTGPPGAAPAGSRKDAILVSVTNTGSRKVRIEPRFVIESVFALEQAGENAVNVDGRESVASTHPVAEVVVEKTRGYQAQMLLEPLSIPPEKMVEFAVLYSGGAADPAPVSVESVREARSRAETYWQQVPLPFDSVTVPDRGIQALVDSAIRNIWQAREIKEGLPAFQVGPTCYRGLWIVDGAFLLEAAAMVGAGDEARAGVQYMLGKQKENGAFEVLTPKYYKENGIVLWTCVRHARLTQDKKWLRSVWSKLEKTVDYIKTLRQRSLEDPDWLCAGLMPPGDIDGGLWNSQKGEYTNVYWNLLGLKAAIRAARWLGEDAQAAEWQQEYDDFYRAFRNAADRDMQTDPAGNRYLPTIMGNIGEELPQRAQWAFCHGVYPGQLFEQDDPLVAGNLAMLEATEREGMVYGTGWDAEGLWNYFASFYGHAWLWQDNGPKACGALYAFANHASPLLAWREEQNLKGEPYKKVGDMPHNWASAEFIRLTIHLLALDRGNELHLLEGMPAAWAKPGMRTALKGVATPFGPLTFSLKVEEDSARLDVQPLSDPSCEKIVVHLNRWTGRRAPEVIELEPAQANSVTIALSTNERKD